MGIDLDEGGTLSAIIEGKEAEAEGRRVSAEKGFEGAEAIDALLAARAEAKAARDFARADAIRSGLTAAGVVVMDTAKGSEWTLGPDFDAAKLEGL
jgi:cysteinyl-tRNA synthetase